MERLTERDKNGTAMAACCGENCKHNYCCENGGFAECVDMDDIIDRLAAYEDTGLEPEAIEHLKLAIMGKAIAKITVFEGVPIDRLRELALADREGEIPKYTIGDTVYDRYGEPWQVVSAELHSMCTKNEWLYRCGHEGTDDYRALWHFEAFPSREAALRREQDE